MLYHDWLKKIHSKFYQLYFERFPIAKSKITNHTKSYGGFGIIIVRQRDHVESRKRDLPWRLFIAREYIRMM